LIEFSQTKPLASIPTLHYPESDVIHDILVQGCKDVEGHSVRMQFLTQLERSQRGEQAKRMNNAKTFSVVVISERL
jgi:hypothetical protein